MILKDEPSVVIEEGTAVNGDSRPVCILHYEHLRELVICDRNYCGGCDCVIMHDQLQTLVVKDRCFYEGCCYSNVQGLLRIMSCCSLKVISIGDSFCNYPKFQLSGKHSSHL